MLDQDTARWLDAGLGATVSLYPRRRPGAKARPRRRRLAAARRACTARGGDPTDSPPAATLTLVGIAASVSTPDVAAWMSPTDLARLTPGRGTPPPDALPGRAVRDARLTSARPPPGSPRQLPPDAVANTVTYLDTKVDVDRIAQLYVPVLLAFSLFALLAAAFTIANVVGGIVLSGYRDIGVMKAVGFTPRQISAILLGQILVPVTIGAIAGVVAGTLASQPVVKQAAQSFGLPATFSLSWTVVLAVLGVSLAVALVAALGPALHAGRLSAVSAIARGTAPSRRHDGGRLRRLGLRLPLGIPARLGVAAGVAHPGRAAMTLGALLVGVAAVTFAYGLNQSLLRVMTQLDRTVASPVRVELVDPTADGATLTATIATQPGTGHSTAIGESDAMARGLGAVPFVGYQGDASWTGYELIAGRWFTGPGEAVAPTLVFTRTGLQIGDTLELASGGRSVTVRLVGEIFDTADETPGHLILRGAWADLVALDPGRNRPTGKSSRRPAPHRGITAPHWRPRRTSRSRRARWMPRTSTRASCCSCRSSRPWGSSSSPSRSAACSTRCCSRRASARARWPCSRRSA